MPLETPLYIDTLVPEWPTGADPLNAGDDHIRVIKQVLKNTFPNIAGAVNATSQDLDALTGHIDWLPGSGVDTDIERVEFHNETWTAPIPITFSTPTAAQRNANQALGVNWQIVVNCLFPIGHILTTKRAGNPADWMGFGAWSPLVGYLAGTGDAGDLVGKVENIALGYHGGYWRVQSGHIVYWEPALVIDAVADHTHTLPGLYANNDTSTEGGGTPTYGDTTHTTSPAGGHGHAGRVGIGTGDLINGAAMSPPRHGVYVWERTA